MHIYKDWMIKAFLHWNVIAQQPTLRTRSCSSLFSYILSHKTDVSAMGLMFVSPRIHPTKCQIDSGEKFRFIKVVAHNSIHKSDRKTTMVGPPLEWIWNVIQNWIRSPKLIMSKIESHCCKSAWNVELWDKNWEYLNLIAFLIRKYMKKAFWMNLLI